MEVYLWAKNYINKLKKYNIKVYNILYLSDSLWNIDPRCITDCDKIYYATTYLKDTHLSFLKIQEDLNRDNCPGSPIFDCIKQSTGSSVLVLLPNLKTEHVSLAFGDKKRFISIIKALSNNNKLIIKTRKKQWFPEELRVFTQDIYDDGDIMYPSVISELFKKTHATVMFYSSGVYEAVFAGQYVVNIPINLKRWSWDKKRMGQYFSNNMGSLYNFDGVVESVSQEDVLSDKWQLKNSLNQTARQDWLDKFIGFNHHNGTKNIVNSVINS